MTEISFRGSVMVVSRAKFRRWTQLEEIRDQITKAVDIDDLSTKISQYVSTALDISISEIVSLPWEEVATAFTELLQANSTVRILPFMRYRPDKQDEIIPYDYDGRLFYHYAHTLASEYGWTLEYAAELDVDDAFSLLQEVLVSRYTNREWEWDLSERSVGYDDTTKKSKHIQFPLPDWMLPVPQAPKIYKIPKTLIPVGNVVHAKSP